MSMLARAVRQFHEGARDRRGMQRSKGYFSDNRAVTHRLGGLWCHFIITPVTTALILAGCAASGVLDVSWVATTTTVDGSPLTDVATYLVY